MTLATGTRAAAPAETFHAAAVTPAARRSGTTTPCAPNAPAERSTAPRLRGSVTPSSATTNGAAPARRAAASTASRSAYSYGGTCIATPWWARPSVILSSSARVTSASGRCRSVVSLRISRTRSSTSIWWASHTPVQGTPARNASTTGLRPATSSAPLRRVREPRSRCGRCRSPPSLRPPCSAAALRRWAAW